MVFKLGAYIDDSGLRVTEDHNLERLIFLLSVLKSVRSLLLAVLLVVCVHQGLGSLVQFLGLHLCVQFLPLSIVFFFSFYF